jgi:hypothetical protein
MTESPKECEKPFIPNMSASVRDPSYPNLDDDRLREYCGVFGVFDLDDGRSAYGVCMTFIRTRQRVNGYP